MFWFLLLLVPSDRFPFCVLVVFHVSCSVPVTKCSNFSISAEQSGCPREKLVNINKTLQFALTQIEALSSVASDPDAGQFRCGPVIYPRLARGGKSTFLMLLFDELKKSEKFAPIIISFNGGFAMRDNETALQAMQRVIACKFVEVDASSEARRVVCDEKTLMQHISDTSEGKHVILLIDELNILGTPLDIEAANFLKTRFLDSARRYLVFTSHMPIDLEFFENRIMKPSSRDNHFVPLPICHDLSILQSMSKACESLTPVEAVIHGYIPSLIYSMKGGETTFLNRYKAIFRSNFPDNDRSRRILGEFIREVLRGSTRENEENEDWMCAVRKFDVFGSTTLDRTIEFPIGYIAAILDDFEYINPNETVSMCNNLLMYATTTDSGKDWELIIQFALMLHCLDACVNGGGGPFDILANRRGVRIPGLKFEFITLSTEFVSITSDALKAKVYALLDGFSHPVILVIAPVNCLFSVVDFIVATKIDMTTKVFGVQCKKGRDKPQKEVPDWFEKGFLVCGNASDFSYTSSLKTWTYLTKADVLHLLGHSLSSLYPGRIW